MRASKVRICAFRVSRTDPDVTGRPDWGNPVGALTFCGGIASVAHEITTQTIPGIFEVDGCGSPVVDVPEETVATGITVTLNVQRSDERLDEILGVGELAVVEESIVGVSTPALPGCSTAGKVYTILEWWVQRQDCATPADPPFYRYIAPLLHAVPQGYTNENGLAVVPFSGTGQPNANFGDGPFHDLGMFEDDRSPWPIAKVRDVALPECPEDEFDYQALPSAS